MPHYVLLMRYHSEGLKAARDDPRFLIGIQDAMERWEAKVLASYNTMGIWDHCLIVDAPDNFKAYRAALAQEMSVTAETEILPAIDLPLFQRLMSQSVETDGPHEWQIRWWARVARLVMYDYQFGRWARKNFTEHVITGKEKFDDISTPCIVISNHASHFDQYCLMKAIPWRIRSNLFFGAAADRWFLKGRKEITLRAWYASLVGGLYPIHRGGGSNTLDYPKWLLDQGANLMLFPEGTRSRGRNLSKFKHGVSLLALDKKVPVVPIYMAGLRKIRPPGTKEVVPGPVAAHVLDPIYFEEGTEVPEATARIFKAMKTVHDRVLEHGNEAAHPNWQS
ncbi:MAG: 1-acyl-sn-glycerol-3-phosphate acyltransferase [Pseudomonadales bacterium]|jgi:1-acyl-sn-glycerol-3-phosphate acyltransferase|nr:1-acyl-sn-glycerol-3-phosphate acyltransferase [Pseudomonadales bacterium]MDP6471071.1 1-acyl-sn-glycerol-3-phosphate acyltransferase [Pseudomonadales bacterium]MDP6825743.1 1-acyl-sn-glycerol-3-phosphate acyltransferase [Pseudomonadales bacterium]MDP6970714.1 1-acyl-sn-glycerol-3-phosphate acyltransferase [Pseudomonadales bacterium]|tara:strand:- start:1130 stop:2137 length:1008 start_codon:yes stop_codon:yes gene_type:complete